MRASESGDLVRDQSHGLLNCRSDRDGHARRPPARSRRDPARAGAGRLRPSAGGREVTPRRLLIVSYGHPPFPAPAGNRWLAMAHYLRRAGHTVTILASGAFGGLADDAELGVIRVSDLMSARVVRRLLRRGELAAPLATSGPEAGLELPPPALLTKVLVPDPYAVSWLPAMFVAARRLVARESFDCLVTSGPPESVHLVGLLLGARRPAWIADFRDGWLFESTREPFPTAVQRRLDAALERLVVTHADIVATVTEPISDDFHRRYGVDAVTVQNAYDPASDAEVEAAELPPLPADRRLIVHTGTLSGLRGRDPRPLLEALRRLAGEPAVASHLALVQVGSIRPSDEALLRPLRELGLVHTVGVVPRTTAMALQRRAAALLLITSADVSQSTAKLYEYLAAGRPIIALAESNEAARIVRETNTGVTVPPGDVDAIAAALRSVVTGELVGGYAPRGVERYTYPAPAEAMAELVETAIRRRAGPEGRA